MKVRLATHVLLIVCGVAVATTTLTLLVQAVSLTRDLEVAALRRVERAARAVNLLAESHLKAVLDRYRAISDTAEFRAILGIDHAPTLEHYADSLRSGHGASYVALVDRDNNILAASGGAHGGALELAPDNPQLVASEGALLAVLSVALEAGGRPLGRLVVAQPILPATIDEWSELCGAQVVLRNPGDHSKDSVSTRVRKLGDQELSVVSTLEAERAAVAKSLYSLLAAGGVALISALPIAIFLARGLVRPIVKLRDAAERISAGNFQVELESARGDEIGDASRAFGTMAESLRGAIAHLGNGADRVEETTQGISKVTERLLEVTASQIEDFKEVATTTDRIKAQVIGISRSAEGFEQAVRASSVSLDEQRRAGASMSEYADRLSASTGDIASSIDRMTASASKVGDALESLSEVSEATSSIMLEMEASTQAVNENAEQTERLSLTAVETAEQGRARVGETVREMEEILNATINAQGAIQDLGADVGGIGGIVTVIGEVSEQANMLALNAAIIAAQAGEYGRPFAVVATEMKDLAGRVSTHTKEIEALISGAQEKATMAIATVRASAERVEQGVHVALQAGASLEAITLAARESESRMKEVVHAVFEQMRTTKHVVEQMEQLRNGVEQIGAAREDQDRSIEVVQACSQSLDDVARLTKEAIEVQARDAVHIKETIEAVGTSFDTIRSALEEQSSACMQATNFIERSGEHTDANEDLARRLAEVVSDLLQQAESMRDDVRRLNA